jgi:hypothetical protein
MNTAKVCPTLRQVLLYDEVAQVIAMLLVLMLIGEAFLCVALLTGFGGGDRSELAMVTLVGFGICALCFFAIHLRGGVVRREFAAGMLVTAQVLRHVKPRSGGGYSVDIEYQYFGRRFTPRITLLSKAQRDRLAEHDTTTVLLNPSAPATVHLYDLYRPVMDEVTQPG